MGKIVICGGRRLNGRLDIQGSKNAVLPILAASILCRDTCVLKNCPEISDVHCALEIIESLGGKTKREGSTLLVDTSGITGCEIRADLMCKMRSSVMFLGAILSRAGKATVCTPGGCEIGARPIDLHIRALKELGIAFSEQNEDGKMICRMENPHAAVIELPFPSVGATENIMMASVFLKGTTAILNPAREPEISELQNFINAMGGRVRGAGTDAIYIDGVSALHGGEFTIRGDRIVCATYLFGAAAAGGDVTFCGIPPKDLKAVLSVLEKAGCEIQIHENEISLLSNGRLRGVGKIKTTVFPGFPTDAQAPLTACLAASDGVTELTETIFENRFRHIGELLKMGANITVNGRTAVICGVPHLTGACVFAKELRGAGALVAAGLSAHGTTVVGGTEYLDRGYVNIEHALGMLGADIYRKQEKD